jgi:hypothetical protein
MIMQYIEQTEIEDQLFPTDNILEVPTLREDMQAKAVQIPFVCFGEQRRTYDMQGASDAEKKANWNKSYNNLIKALSHVEKHGTDFEKSVAATIKKGLHKYDEKAFKVGYVSFKQSQIIGKSLAETHFKIN